MSAISRTPLSAQDRTFLPYETATSHMHITWTLVFDPPARGTVARLATLRRQIASRLARLPRLRECLAFAPITGEPCWVEDERFDLACHVRAVRLAAPGDDAALKAMTAWLVERQLARERPLWEAWLVEGLAGRRVAVVFKIHHALADGVATVDVLTSLFATGDTLANDAAPVETHRSATLAERVTAAIDTMRSGISPAPTTALNRPIGPHRRIEWTSVDLDVIRAVRDVLGGTLNDVVLAIVAGAVRSFLGPAASNRQFRVVVPVSTRAREERRRLGNRASAWIVPLPIDEADPRRRLAHVRAETTRFKESRQALGGELMNDLAGLFGSAMTTLGIRVLTEWIRPYNLIVTNIPGPAAALALGAAPVVEAYPQVPLFPNQGLGIALSSDRRRLFWGFSADPDVVPNLACFREAIRDALAELLQAARRPHFHLDNQTFV